MSPLEQVKRILTQWLWPLVCDPLGVVAISCNARKRQQGDVLQNDWSWKGPKLLWKLVCMLKIDGQIRQGS